MESTSAWQRVFPPEPNGYLHIGHAKSICLNFGIANENDPGACHLRFDDTNPLTEDTEYVHSIQNDVRWLGFDWGEHLYFASDYFEKFYQYAVELVEKGKAYVCELNEEQIREYRGTVTEPGRPSPWRDRPIAENLDLLQRMRAGEFEDGSRVLRAKIDMGAANMKMRDPLIYRIRKAHHHRTGDDWCIYPMYDFAHCLEDAIEGITHSICTLEFENNREVYDWFLAEVSVPCQPQQIEFARLNLNYTVMSKRKLLELVERNYVSGWDDPRMPTISGLRRRGYTPESIRNFCDMVGVAKANSVVDVAMLEYAVRNDLNPKVPRVMCVLRPLKVIIDNYGEGEELLDASYYPHDVPLEGSRPVPFTRELFIDRDDFMEDPPKKYFRLAPGREVRLRYGYVIRCDRVVKDEDGNVVALHCTYDPESLGGKTSDGRKVKGVIHWVSATKSLSCEVRLYDRLFNHEKPDGDKNVDFKEHLNPDSLVRLTDARIEPEMATTEPGNRYQFERQGFFCADPIDSKEGALVFNRIVTLRDSWAKMAEKPEPSKKKAKAAAPAPARARETIDDPVFERYHKTLDLSYEEARLLYERPELAAFFDAALNEGNHVRAVANLVLNELKAELKDRAIDDLPFKGAAIGRLAGLIEDQTISGPIAKKVLAEMLRSGGEPAEIVEKKGLKQVTDLGELEPVIDRLIAENPDKVQRYRDGKKNLMGFFVGEVMKATRGKANPKIVNQLIGKKLSS